MAKRIKKENAPELFTPSQVGQIFNVDPKTVTRWTKKRSADTEPKLDSVKTPNNTVRITGDSLVSSGVCRNCWQLKSVGGKCGC
jgi:hypothetical protein